MKSVHQSVIQPIRRQRRLIGQKIVNQFNEARFVFSQFLFGNENLIVGKKRRARIRDRQRDDANLDVLLVQTRPSKFAVGGKQGCA